MAAYAALVSLLNNMEEIKNNPRLLSYFHKNQIESLAQKARFLLDFIETYNSDGGSKEAQDLETQIASAALESEDVIEHHIADQILNAESRENEHVVESVQTDILTDDQLHDRWLLNLQEAIVDMDSVNNKVARFKEERGIKPTNSNSMLVSSSTPSTTGKSNMVGFKDELAQLLDVLIGQQLKRQIVPIVGMGGTGKTTLAKYVYQDSLILNHFDFRAWATISQVCNVREILLQLLSSQGKVIDEIVYKFGQQFYSDDEINYKLGELLYKILSGRRYLIVLDDMWGIDVWDSINFFLADNNNGSRVVLTTRLSNMVTQLCSICIRINFLDEHTSWNLFCQNVFGQEDCPPELVEIGKKIVEQCKGLPLTIVVIGGLLQKSYRTERYWHSVATNINSILNSSENEELCLNILYLSYSHLSAHLKSCFLYMGTFKEDHEIRVSEITKLWVAEGFIKPNGIQILEEIAEDYLKCLIDRHLILICARCLNGKIKSCRIHDLLRELCLREAKKEKFFCVVRAPKISQDVDRERCMQYTTSSNHMEFWKKRFQQYKTPSNYTEIWKMRQLRHVKCSRIMLPDPYLSDDSVVLENLQTLRVVVNFRWSEEACRRILNVKKLRIAYDDILEGYDHTLFGYLQNLGRLNKLESLYIQCSWTTLVSINELKSAFPNSLNKLSLSGCTLGWEVFSMIIGSLPHLEVLKLKEPFCEMREWSCTEGEFLRLKFLQIESCDLNSWTVESASYFPVLEKLVLLDLWSLNEIPSAIGEISTLQLIHLEHCTYLLTASAMKIKEEQESFGNDDIEIKIWMNPLSNAMFQQMLKIGY